MLFKPLCDSHRTADLLDGLELRRPPRAMWAYRSVDGRARSAVAKFGDTNLRLLRELAAGTDGTALAEEPGPEQERELRLSRQQLEQELDLPVGLLAYPNGKQADYSRATIAAAARAGYTHAVTTVEGWNRPVIEPYEVRRFVQQPERGAPGLAVVPLRPVWSRVRPGLRRRPELPTPAK